MEFKELFPNKEVLMNGDFQAGILIGFFAGMIFALFLFVEIGWIPLAS
jgi:hypothetical protein